MRKGGHFLHKKRLGVMIKWEVDDGKVNSMANPSQMMMKTQPLVITLMEIWKQLGPYRWGSDGWRVS